MTATAPSQIIPALLRAIAGEPPAGALHVSEHSLHKQLHLDPASIRPGWIPAGILAALEARDSVHVSLATRGEGHAPVQQLAVAAVSFTVGLTYERGAHQMSRRAFDAAHATLQACPVAPTFVLVGTTPIAGQGWRLTALWALQQPFDLRTPAGLAEAHGLLQDLTTGLAADPPPADLAAWTVELPGSRMRERPAVDEFAVALAVGDLARRHTPAALRAALTPQETQS